MTNQPLTYRDFQIEMSGLRDDGKFLVRVMDKTPMGQTMPAAQAEAVTYNADDFTSLVGRVERRRATQAELLELGTRLCSLLLPGLVRTLFNESLHWVEQNNVGLRVRLSIEPPSLGALPWEYTHVPRRGGEPSANDFLVLQHRVSLVRSENIGLVMPPLAGKDKLRVVVALASPISKGADADKLPALDLLPEETAVKNAIKDVNEKQSDVAAIASVDKNLSLDAVWVKPATRTKLFRAIKGADIFHFAGHGLFNLSSDGSFRRQGQIVLEKDDESPDPYPSDQLANLLANSGVRLVVLGACESAARDTGGAWSGVASALTREKIPCVVGMQFTVANTEAARFTPLLYAGMVAGISIDEAVSWGRQAIFTHVDDWAYYRDWGTPVLYLLAPDGNLFPLPDMEGLATDSRRVEVRQQFADIRNNVDMLRAQYPNEDARVAQLPPPINPTPAARLLSATTTPASPPNANATLSERERVQQTLDNLDERLASGKISEATYDRLSAKWEQKLKELDA